MDNIINYIGKYGEMGFDQLDFNEVDSLILSQMVYSDIKYASDNLGEKFFIRDLHNQELAEKMSGITWIPAKDVKLIMLVSQTKRYMNLLVSDIFECEDIGLEGQITACVIALSEDRRVLIFRGTDSSFSGWAESFALSFEEEVSAQRTGRDYLKKIAEKYEGSIILAGHSKGGNLVAFAASTIDKEIQDRIEKVYDLDGPGFLDDFFKREDYTDISDKIFLYTPKKSLVGLLLNNIGILRIVKGRGTIVGQHYPYNWSIKDSAFDFINETGSISKIVNKSIEQWLVGLDMASRKDLILSLYKLFEHSGADNVKEILDKGFSGLVMLKDSFSNMDEEEAKLIKDALFDFFSALKKSFFNYYFVE